MRTLVILFFMLTLIPSAYSRPTDYGPEKWDAKREEMEAEAARKKAEAEAAANSYEGRTKDAEREVQKLAILRLMETSIEARSNAKKAYNDNELIAKQINFYMLNTQQKSNVYNINFNQNIDANLARANNYRDTLSDKISGILLSLYMNETKMLHDNFIQNLK